MKNSSRNKTAKDSRSGNRSSQQSNPYSSQKKRAQTSGARTYWKNLLTPGFFLLLLLCAILVIGGYYLQFDLFPKGWPLDNRFVSSNATTEVSPISDILINEIMSSNSTAWPGARSLYPDWVEITNTGKKDVDISGWTLTDRPNRKRMFTFAPGTVMASGEYLVIYMTGDFQNQLSKPLEAPFKLSSSGDALLLYNENGSIMQAMNIPALNADTVYAFERSSGSYTITRLFTPGLPNTRSSHSSLKEYVAESPIVINEVMADNATTLQDEDGEYSDWLELYNTGDTEIDLEGYGLSDDADRPLKWLLPSVSLSPGEYMIIFMSGKDRANPGKELHTNFRLAPEGEPLCLYDASGHLLQRLDFDRFHPDESYSRIAGSDSFAATAPTPGAANAK